MMFIISFSRPYPPKTLGIHPDYVANTISLKHKYVIWEKHLQNTFTSPKMAVSLYSRCDADVRKPAKTNNPNEKPNPILSKRPQASYTMKP